jgi:hypothetical protein
MIMPAILLTGAMIMNPALPVKHDPHVHPSRSREIAVTLVKQQGWSGRQFVCLNKLWTKESNWRNRAQNKTYIGGRRAGGIPQILGLDPKTPVKQQIDRGLKYIKHRYSTPCGAWSFWKKHKWY